MTAISDIIGTTAIGETLRVGAVVPYGATVSYQWKKSLAGSGPYTDIEGATSGTLTLTDAEKGYYIKVEATGIGAYSGTVISEHTGPVVDPWEITGINPIGAISGATQVGSMLTAGSLSPAGATATYQWQSSATIDGTYDDIPGATSKNYTLTDSDYGRYIRVVATGSGNYSGEVCSESVGPIEACPLTGIGAIGGTTTTGHILSAGTLSPAGAKATYQWMKSDAPDGIYTNIAGATSSTYVLKESDQGAYIKVVAEGIGGYSGTVISEYTGPVTAQVTPLEDIGAITGTLQVEQTLTVGALSPVGATATYQWQRADSADGSYTDIPGATHSTYKLTANDYGKYIRVSAKGAGVYSGTVTSISTGPIGPCPLYSIANITGVARVNNTLTAGELSPIGATATYQWQKLKKNNNPITGNYTNIAGATSDTYTLTSDDTDHYIRVVATGTGAYTGSVTSHFIGLVVPAGTGIELTGIAEITGVTKVGGTLYAGPLFPAGASATYQWRRSSTFNGTYADIPGATSSSYTTTAADRDCYIKVVATGSGYYTGEAISAWVGPIAPIPITGMGTIAGSTSVGQMLTAGTLTPYGATATYRWQRSETAYGEYTDIIGATDSTYKLTTADIDKYIRVRATGTGAYSGTITSAYTGPVTDALTPITAIGAISGTARVLETLTAGDLTPSDAKATYQWQRSSDGVNFSDIPGATGSTYRLTADDYNHYIRLQAFGAGTFTGTVTSSATAQIAACPIESLSPTIGTAFESYMLYAGTVMPEGAIVTYQWQGSSNGKDFEPIPGATSSSYRIGTDQREYKYYRVVVTGTNGFSGTLTSNIVGDVLKKESDIKYITAVGPISGVAEIGGILTYYAGAISPAGATVTYQWQKCETENGTYSDIYGATGPSFTVTDEEVGYFIRVVITGSNHYAGTSLSPKTGPAVEEAMDILGISDIVGTCVVGKTLTAGDLIPTGATAFYQWQIANAPEGPYTDIPDADDSTYTIAAGDVGKYIRVVATGYGVYEGTAISNPTGPVAQTAIPLESVSIEGILRVGETVTAVLKPDGATATFKWQIWSEPYGLYTYIDGTTSQTLPLGPSEYNYYLRVIATGSGQYEGTVYSDYTPVMVAKYDITGFDPIPDIYAGTAGSAIYADAAEVIAVLPDTVTADGGVVTVPVAYWEDTDSYNPDAAGSYTFTAIIEEMPEGYGNPDNHQATVEVIVDPIEIIEFDAITDIDGGMAGMGGVAGIGGLAGMAGMVGSANAIDDAGGRAIRAAVYATAAEVIAALPDTVTANGGQVSVPVLYWEDTDSYDPYRAGSYTFTAVLGDLPPAYANPRGYTATVEVVLAEAPEMEMIMPPEGVGLEGALIPGDGEVPIEGEVPVEGDVPVEGEDPADGETPHETEETVESEKAADDEVPVEGEMLAEGEADKECEAPT